jgi:hypothetical protein
MIHSEDNPRNVSIAQRIAAAEKERADVASSLSEDAILAAMDPNGATMDLDAIIQELRDRTGHSKYVLSTNVQNKLRHMRKAGRVEFTKGPGSGWRSTRKTP